MKAWSRSRIEFVAQTSRRESPSRKIGISFSSSLAITCVSGRCWRLDAISSTSSMKTTTRSRYEQLIEELAERAGAAVRVGADELAREDLDERPAEASGDRLRERRLAGAGRPEEDDRRRSDHAVALRLVALGERQDHAALDQLLLALHAADRLPQLRRQPLPAELGSTLSSAEVVWRRRFSR